MAYNVSKIGFIDITHVRTEPVDKERVKATDGDCSIWMESSGPNGDGVEMKIDYGEPSDDMPDICRFFIPDSSWKTFVQAIKSIDVMWDEHA